MKSGIINIMSHLPAYEEYADKPKPKINWSTPNGSWVGIGGNDWADLIGFEILRINHDIDYQVWQPDLRADKVYSHTFDSNLKHCLFPATKDNNEALSQLMISEITKISNEKPVIVILPPPYYDFTIEMLKNLKKTNNVWIACAWGGEFNFPAIQFFRLRKRISKYFALLKKHFEMKNAIANIDGVIYINNKNLSYLKRYFKGHTALIPMGVDFSYWQAGSKTEARKKLNLPGNKKIILSSSRLVSLKQIDKLILSLKKLPVNLDYLMIISGHGTRGYEKYLQEKAGELILSGKLVFTGYVSEEQLLLYYQAADLFIMTSSTEGSPVNVQKALACEVPVMTTAVGLTAELLIKNNAGIILPVKKYKHWTEEIKKFIDGCSIRILERKIAEQNFEWSNIAKKYLSFYDKIINT